MTKKIVAKTGEYQKDGETKGRYVDVGVILSNDKGDYIMLDPSVSLSGVLAKQNAMNRSGGKQERDNVMCSIFDNNNRHNNPPQPANSQQNNGQGVNSGAFDDGLDIPF